MRSASLKVSIKWAMDNNPAREVSKSFVVSSL